jgi:predicted ATPase
MGKVVTVVGGTNGAGKSHLTERLVADGDYTVTKQKRELVAAGERRGIP